jgi:hypothetical protein
VVAPKENSAGGSANSKLISLTVTLPPPVLEISTINVGPGTVTILPAPPGLTDPPPGNTCATNAPADTRIWTFLTHAFREMLTRELPQKLTASNRGG